MPSVSINLPDIVRVKLLEMFPIPPIAGIDIDADHITVAFGISKNKADLLIAQSIHSIKLLGVAEDEELGIKALAVSVNDETIRPDGLPYHITWWVNPASEAPLEWNMDGVAGLTKAFKLGSRHSAFLLLAKGFEPFPEPIDLTEFSAALSKDHLHNLKMEQTDFGRPGPS